jgi:hypothetical protein
MNAFYSSMVFFLYNAYGTQTDWSPPASANFASQPCIRLDPHGVRTIKQPFASTAKLR